MARTTAQLEGWIVRGTTAGVQHSSSEAIDTARHGAEPKSIHPAPDQDSGLMRLRVRPCVSPHPALAQRTSVRGRK
jgi:hypothetical protein